MSEQRTRSPRYPSLPLGEAIELARKLYAGDGMHPVDREVAAGHMGYRGVNGASAQALGSLSQYGLTETSGRGLLRLTSLSLDILEPQSAEDRIKSLHQAAWTPKLFSELREKFPSTTPSEANLRAYLIRQNYQPTAVKSVIPAYLRTCDYLSAEGAPESSRQAPQATSVTVQNQTTRESYPTETQAYPQHASPITPVSVTPSPIGTRREVFALDEGEVVITLPHRLSADSIEDIEAWLEIVARKLRRMATSPKDARAKSTHDSAAAPPIENEDEPT